MSPAMGQSFSESTVLLLVMQSVVVSLSQGWANTRSGWRANLLAVIPALVHRPWTTFTEMSAQPEQKMDGIPLINWVNATQILA